MKGNESLFKMKERLEIATRGMEYTAMARAVIDPRQLAEHISEGLDGVREGLPEQFVKKALSKEMVKQTASDIMNSKFTPEQVRGMTESIQEQLESMGPEWIRRLIDGNEQAKIDAANKVKEFNSAYGNQAAAALMIKKIINLVLMLLGMSYDPDPSGEGRAMMLRRRCIKSDFETWKAIVLMDKKPRDLRAEPSRTQKCISAFAGVGYIQDEVSYA